MAKIIVIGMNRVHDLFVVDHILRWMEQERKIDLSGHAIALDVYDMEILPERGDAYSNVDVNTLLVVTCNVYGLDQQHARTDKAGIYFQGMNSKLFDKCLDMRIPMVAWQRLGEHPHASTGNVKETVIGPCRPDDGRLLAILYEGV